MGKHKNATQVTLMLEFMQQNMDLAKGFTKRNKSIVYSLWQDLTDSLNAAGPPTKEVNGWKKVWTEWKWEVKKKLTHNNFAKHNLSQAEDTIVRICGLAQAESRLIDTDYQDVDHNETTSIEPIEFDNSDEEAETYIDKNVQQIEVPRSSDFKRKAVFQLPRRKKRACELNKHVYKTHSNTDSERTELQFSTRFTRDDSAIYGDYIASKHRKYSKHSQSVIEHLIADILFNADLGRYESDAAAAVNGLPNDDEHTPVAPTFLQAFIKDECADSLIDVN